MRQTIQAILVGCTLAACTTTQRSEVKESANTVEDSSKRAGKAVSHGAKEAWKEATAVPPAERDKKVFQARQEARLKEIAAQAEGIQNEADIYDVDDSAAFKKAVADVENAEKIAKDRLAEVRGHDVAGWQNGRKPVDDAVKAYHESVVSLRNVMRETAH